MPPEATASAKRSFVVSAAGTLLRPTNTPHATSSGLDWPFTQRNLREKKLMAAAIREVTTQE
jgi:hypothetical protein